MAGLQADILRMIRSFLSHGKRLVLHPQQEIKRFWFELYHRRRPPHDVICYGKDYSLKLRSDSVLAESLFIGGAFEENEIRFFRDVVKPGMTVFDVGANVGLYSVISGNAVGQSGRVWSFEPFPPIAMYLRENVCLNDLINVTVVEKAVSDLMGTFDFHVFPEGCDVYNSLGAKERPEEKLHAVEKILVEVTTIDAFAGEAGIEKIDILKIDVEGAEERVLKGAEQLIRRSPNVQIVIEIYEPSAQQCGCSSQRLIEMLEGWGFSMFEIGPGCVPICCSAEDFSGVYALFKRE